MRRLEWGVAGLSRDILERLLAERERERIQLTAVNDLLACVLGESGFEAAGAKFVSELATLLDCDRVSLGTLRRERLRVRLISHSAQFGKHMDLVRGIEDAMAEAVEQRRTLIHPLPVGEEPCVLRAHAQLARRSGSDCVLTVPLYRDGRYYAALTLERGENRSFTRDEAGRCEAIATLVTTALEDKRLNDRWLGAKAWDAARRQLGRLFGPRYVGRKLLLMMLIAVIAFFAVVKGDYRLPAKAVLEGAVQRVVAAPFDGFIDSAPLRAGDVAAEGETLATLDSRDLRIERLKWVSQQAQLERQLQEALGKRDRARAKIARARIGQAAAELELVTSKLARTRLTAPFAGIVVSGDLSQRLGSSVKQGEELFQIAPLHAYRVIMRVPERRIADVAAGRRGSLLLAALPEIPYPFAVTRVTPVTEVADGGTFFRVEGKLDGGSKRLRPGMEGIAKIDVDRRLLARIWTRDVIEWLRLKLWRLWG